METSNPQDMRAAMMAQFMSIQQQFTDLREELSSAVAVGVSRCGLVSARVSSASGLTELVIEPAAMEDRDSTALAESVLDAVNDATDRIRRMSEGRITALTDLLERVRSYER